MWHVVGVPSEISLLAASMDLQLVKLLRDAMRTTACATKLGVAVACARSRCIEPRVRIDPEPFIEPRVVITPTPRFEPRPVYYVREPVYLDPNAPLPAPTEPECPRKTPPVCPPPWKSLPPVEHPEQVAPKVKVLIQRPDIVTKGSLIDFFM